MRFFAPIKGNPGAMRLAAGAGTGAHMTYQIPTAPCKPSAEIIPLSTANAREWWAVESRRVGSDWVSIAEVVAAIMHRLAATSWCSS